MSSPLPAAREGRAAEIKRYGVLNEAQGEIPHPTAVVIDRRGIVRFVRVDEDYKKRPTNGELQEAICRLSPPAAS